MSAAQWLGLNERWSARQAGAIIESLRGEFPGMRVTFELPATDGEYGHLPPLARANERAYAVAESETSV